MTRHVIAGVDELTPSTHWHGSEFDIHTGQSYCDPKPFRARAYPVNVSPVPAW
ncbi:MAG: hypothetical protein NVS3B5_17240 [Sphingomicrobium sp.]